MGKKVVGEGSSKVKREKNFVANFWDKDKGRHPLIQLKVNGVLASILLDTGSSTTLVKEDFLPHLLESGNGKLLRIKKEHCQLSLSTRRDVLWRYFGGNGFDEALGHYFF